MDKVASDKANADKANADKIVEKVIDKNNFQPSIFSQNEPILISVSTSEGWNIKTLVNFFQHNITQATFKIDRVKKIWTLTEMNQTGNLMINIVLNDFTRFIYNSPEPVFYIGFIPKKLYNIFKPIKKKDTLQLSIPKQTTDLDKYCLRTEILNKTRHIDKALIINNYEQNEYEFPDDNDYDVKINIDKSEFRDLTSQISSYGKIVTVRAQPNGLIFFAEKNDLYAYNSIKLGSWDNSLEPIFEEKYSTSLIKKLHKCSSFTTNRINIYVKKGNPLRFSIKIGELGYGDMYLSEYDETRDA